MRKLQIPRDIWLRGEGTDESYLLRTSDRKMCCVGIYLKECGVSEEKMCDVKDANNFEVSKRLPEEAYWLVTIYPEGPTAGLLYETNDYRFVEHEDIPDEEVLVRSEEEREEKVKAIFLAYDVEVEFI